MIDDELVLRERLDLVDRAYRLRQARQIGIVFVDGFAVSVARSEVDPWGSRERVGWKQFRLLIEAAEERVGWTPRPKPMASEKESYEIHVWHRRAG